MNLQHLKTVEVTPGEEWSNPPVVFENPPSIYSRPIQEHGGGKYLRKIYSADGNGGSINIDVYCVIEAFKITCPAMCHALKKLLACGQRGKGDKLDDMHGIFDAMWRAIELEKQRQSEPTVEPARSDEPDKPTSNLQHYVCTKCCERCSLKHKLMDDCVVYTSACCDYGYIMKEETT